MSIGTSFEQIPTHSKGEFKYKLILSIIYLVN